MFLQAGVSRQYRSDSLRFGVSVVRASMCAQASPGSVLVPTWNIIGLVAEPSVQLHMPIMGMRRSSRNAAKAWPVPGPWAA